MLYRLEGRLDVSPRMSDVDILNNALNTVDDDDDMYQTYATQWSLVNIRRS